MHTSIKLAACALPLLTSAMPAAQAQKQEAKKPNIIFILTDDQGYGDFSCMGNPYVKTPHMDQLRKNGVFFSNFHVCAVSAPTRASLMTGRFNYRAGVSGVNKSKVNMYEDEHTIAEYLKEDGYQTGLFGKWHLGYNYPMRADDQGFDESHQWNEMQFFRTDPVFEENGVDKQYKDRFLTDVIFEKAIHYIEEKSKSDKPFFTYLATFLPHTHHDGLQVPEEYTKKFDKYSELNWHTKQCYAMIEKVDEQLGLLMEKLKELGEEENTIIMFATDNGPAATYPGVNRMHQERYRCGFRGMKGSPYEGGIRVPLFVNWKGHVEAGSEIKDFAAHVDILPTILDICNLDAKKNKTLDGSSLYPYLKGEKVNRKASYFYHLYIPDMKIRENMWKKGVLVSGDFKLVEGKELFNLQKDPYEQHNLAQEMPEKLQEMRDEYVRRFNEYLSERGLKRQPNIIGNKAQKKVNLYYFEKIPESMSWPVKVEKKGPYTFTIKGIQLNDIKENCQFVIQAKDKIWKQKIDRNSTEMVFEHIKLPKGEYHLSISIEGDEFPKTNSSWTPEQGRYHRIEMGHRLITVELE